MSFRRVFASMAIPLVAFSIAGSRVTAQVTNRGTSLLVPITGVAEAGGMFNGALLSSSASHSRPAASPLLER